MSRERPDFERPQRELRDVLTGLRRRAWVFVVSVLAVGGLAFAIARSQADTYAASAVLLFDDAGQLQQALFGPANASQETAIEQTATDRDLASLPIIAQRTAAWVGHGITASEVSARISLPAGDGSDTLDVTATGPSAAGARALANAFAAETIAYRRQASESEILAARDGVERSIAQAAGNANVAARRAQLRTLNADVLRIRLMASVDDGGIELAQSAPRPTSASSPRPAHDALIGAFAGLLLGLLLALMLDQHDDRLHDPDKAADLLGLPLLGVVAAQKGPRRRRPAGASTAVAGGHALKESTRRLYLRLRDGRGQPSIRSVLVTSPSCGSGRTTVAWHLASAAADAGDRVLLVEADLRGPSLAATLGETGATGLTELMRTPGADPSGFVRRVRLPVRYSGVSDGPAGSSQPGVDSPRLRPARIAPVAPRRPDEAVGSDAAAPGPGIDVLFAGSACEEPYTVLASPAMSRMLAVLDHRYDRLIVDSAPAGASSDGLVLAKLVDGVIIVARCGLDTLGGAQQLADELRGIGVDPLGLVVNGAAASSARAATGSATRRQPGLQRVADQQVPAAATR
jgi:Mrp family chromosome partitioning ATPase/capsular polysaccharide biosynthesis protein